MSDVFNNFGGAFFDDDLGYHEQPFLIQPNDQHDFGCQTNYLPIDLCQQCGPYSPRYNSQSSFIIPVFQNNGRRHNEPRCTGMTYAQAVATPQPVRTPSFSTPTYVQPETAFPPLRAGSPTLPANVTIGHNAQGSTYAQVAQRANHSPIQQQGTSTTNICSPYTQGPFHAGQSIAPDQRRADHGTAGQLLPHPLYAGAPQRHARPQRRPSRSYHTAQTNDPIQDLAQSLEDAIPLAIQPETTLDPRSVSTFIQRTQRGAHRRSISSSAGPSIPSTPAVPATLSTSSITSRRKGEAMRDPSLPFACPVCGKTYHTHEDRKRHIARTHSSVESRPHRCGQLGCGKAFIHPKDLRRHAATHLPPVHIDCPHPDCEKDFTRQDNLDRHVRDFHLVDSGFAGSTSTSRRGSFMAPRTDHNF